MLIDPSDYIMKFAFARWVLEDSLSSLRPVHLKGSIIRERYKIL